MRCPRVFGYKPPASTIAVLACVMASAAVSGCGGDGLDSVVVHGTVTVGGEKADTGEVRFVPIDGTPGSACAATIVDGEYKVEARGGVPVGKHRVEVDARKKTGRQVEQYNGFEVTLVDETVRVGPPQYAGDKSPLTKEITPDFDGRFDIEIPTQ